MKCAYIWVDIYLNDVLSVDVKLKVKEGVIKIHIYWQPLLYFDSLEHQTLD